MLSSRAARLRDAILVLALLSVILCAAIGGVWPLALRGTAPAASAGAAHNDAAEFARFAVGVGRSLERNISSSSDLASKDDGVLHRQLSDVSYILLEPGISCVTAGFADITTSEECFGAAASAAGVTSYPTFVTGFPFSCVFYSYGMMFFGAGGSGSDGNTNQRYLCKGSYAPLTATVSSATTTITSATTLTSTPTTTTEGQSYSFLKPGEICYDVGLGDVQSSQECFGIAARSVGKSGLKQTYIPGTFFAVGCVFDSSANTVFYSMSPGAGAMRSKNFHYICPGIYTSTVTSTITASHTTVSSTATSISTPIAHLDDVTTSETATTYQQVYTLLPLGQTCHSAGLTDVSSAAECFTSASMYVGKGSLSTQDFTGFQLPFSCAFSAYNNHVFFSDRVGADTEASSMMQYMCVGILTTTDTSTTRVTTSGTSASYTTSTSVTTSATITSLSTLTDSSTSATASSITSKTGGPTYSTLSPSQTCADLGLQDVTTSQECFTLAAESAGLMDKPTVDMTNSGFNFYGCVLNMGIGSVMFANDGSPVTVSPNWKYICLGETTTSTTSTTR